MCSTLQTLNETPLVVLLNMNEPQHIAQDNRLEMILQQSKNLAAYVIFTLYSYS